MVVSWGLFAVIMIIGSLGIHFFSKLSNQAAEPALAVFVAHIVATVLVGIFYFLTKNTDNFFTINSKILIWMILMGICIALANCAVVYMYKYGAPISVAVPVTRTAVASLAILIGVIFFSEIVSPMKIGGFILSIIAIYMMTRP